MSRKTRAFALAVATASLVGLSAPVAGAAALQGGPSGFNNDSILNLSGNQIPIQLCNNDIPVNVAGVQVPVDGVSGTRCLCAQPPSPAPPRRHQVVPDATTFPALSNAFQRTAFSPWASGNAKNFCPPTVTGRVWTAAPPDG